MDYLPYKLSGSFWGQDSVGNPNSWFLATQKELSEWSLRHRYFLFNALLLKHTAGPNSSHQLLRVKQIKENYWCTAKCLMPNDKTIILSALIANIKMFYWKGIVPCTYYNYINHTVNYIVINFITINIDINIILSLCMCYILH